MRRSGSTAGAGLAPSSPGRLVISLDFELMWGLRDLPGRSAYEARVRGVWQAVPALLDLFASFEVRATWATVGMLCAEGREDLLASLPALQPAYRDPGLSPYPDLASLGDDERSDPAHFAPSLVRRIAATPGQELGSHTFSHFYCLEEGPSVEDFRADLLAGAALLSRHGPAPRSLVFPRNQYSDRHLAVLPECGLRAFRSNTPGRWYTPRSTGAETRRRRAARLLDSYLPVGGSDVVRVREVPGVPGLVEVPASRFLRPWSRTLAPLDRLRGSRIRLGLEAAARSGGVYHLWWHPHNFGSDLAHNLDFLRELLVRFRELREESGMRSSTMGELASPGSPPLRDPHPTSPTPPGGQ